ncbi:MAG: ABC transporter ATP-binding protein [Dehalococcoidia bacterium]|nr:ABC transporter ATP-binding protein [Dehalococcoidia bacterium]
MLEIEQLTVAIDGKEILHDLSFSIKAGETHVLFGPNGSGKTTLLLAIMGAPRYRVTKGSIIFKGKDIVGLSTDERARLGIGMSLQRPPVVRGVKTRDMVAACIGEGKSEEVIARIVEEAHMGDLIDRDINYGFSGGEIKRSELMQLLAQQPHLALLDEPESGVDLVNIALIGELINELLQKEHPIRDRRRSGLIITHTGYILDYVNARTGYVMLDGTIVCEGDPHEILETIKNKDYEECRRCLK